VNKQEFSELLTSPSLLSSQHIAQLEDVVKNFPYCQAAHILLARITHQSGSMLTEQKVKQAAAYTFDRKKLKHFIVEKASLQTQPVVEDTMVVEAIQPKQEIPVVLIEETREPVITPKPEPAEKEETPTKADTSKDQFYKELEENLQKLHELKRGMSKFKPGEKLKSVEPEKEESTNSVIPVTEYIASSKVEPEKEKIEFKYNKPEDIVKEPVIPPHYQDELASEKETTSDSGLLLEYLSYLDNKRQKRDRKKEEEIIEKFIKEDPSIPQLSPDKLPEQTEDLSEKSTKITKTPASENFARILLLQGKRDKALEIYEELILKYPEKSAYFAAKIEELKK